MTPLLRGRGLHWFRSAVCFHWFILIEHLYYNLPISVCLCVCPFFWPPSHGPISYLTTYLDSLWHSGPNKSITEVIRAQTKKFLHSYGYGSIAIWMSVCLSEWFYTLTKCLSVCPNYSIIHTLQNVCLSVRMIKENQCRMNWTPPAPEGRGNGAEGAHLRVSLIWNVCQLSLPEKFQSFQAKVQLYFKNKP